MKQAETAVNLSNAQTHPASIPPSSFAAIGLVFGNEMRTTLRNPVMSSMSLTMPLLYLFLLGPLLTGISEIQGQTAGGAYNVFVPAYLISLALWGAAFAGMPLVAEWRAGALERMFSSPVSRAALVTGRVLKDVVVTVCEGIVFVLAAMLLGFRNDVAHVAICLGLVALVTVATASLSYLLALKTKDEGALSAVFNTFMLPIVLLAGVMLPMSLAPGWLQAASRWNPITYVVDASRAAMVGNLGDGTLAGGYLAAVALAAICLAAAIHTFRSQE